MSAGQHSPLDQFKIKPLVEWQLNGIDLSFTNASLFMLLAVGAIIAFLSLAMRQRAVVPGRWQSAAEFSYEFIAGMLKDIVGSEGKPYFPFVFSVFMFVLVANLLGMLPYSFTVTSHIAVTFGLAAVIFVGVTLIALMRHGLHFFGYFLPPGTPLWLAPLMIVIEVFAYFTRPVSLSIRLAANMMAGHLLLKVIAGFIVAMGIAGVFPLGFIVMLTGFEIFVAVLQAYIFTILTCVYLHDAVHLH